MTSAELPKGSLANSKSFHTTRWSIVLAAKGESSSDAQFGRSKPYVGNTGRRFMRTSENEVLLRMMPRT